MVAADFLHSDRFDGDPTTVDEEKITVLTRHRLLRERIRQLEEQYERRVEAQRDVRLNGAEPFDS